MEILSSKYFLIFLFLQFIFTGFFINTLNKLLFNKNIELSLNQCIFLLPFFTFIGRKFKLKTNLPKGYDIVSVEIESFIFILNPIYLLIGRVHFSFVSLKNPSMNYLNFVSSMKKIKYLPKISQVIIKRLFVKNGFMDIEDRSVFPIYKVKIEKLILKRSLIDFAIPFKVLFNSKLAYCRIGSGYVKSSEKKNTGRLDVKGLTWGEIISLQGLPLWFLNNHLNLHLNFVNFNKESHFTGAINFEKLKDETGEIFERKKKIEFSYRVNWREYRLPFDLALKKSVSALLVGLNYVGVLSFGIRIVISTINNLLLNIETQKPEES